MVSWLSTYWPYKVSPIQQVTNHITHVDSWIILISNYECYTWREQTIELLSLFQDSFSGDSCEVAQTGGKFHLSPSSTDANWTLPSQNFAFEDHREMRARKKTIMGLKRLFDCQLRHPQKTKQEKQYRWLSNLIFGRLLIHVMTAIEIEVSDAGTPGAGWSSDDVTCCCLRGQCYMDIIRMKTSQHGGRCIESRNQVQIESITD